MVLSDGFIICWKMAIHIDGLVPANENDKLLGERKGARTGK